MAGVLLSEGFGQMREEVVPIRGSRTRDREVLKGVILVGFPSFSLTNIQVNMQSQEVQPLFDLPLFVQPFALPNLKPPILGWGIIKYLYS